MARPTVEATAPCANLVLELDDGVAHRLDRCLRFGGLELRGEPQPQRRQVLQRLVVKLAGPVGTFLLGRRDALPAALALDRHRGRDGRGRAGRERLRQALVLSAERRPVLEPVDRDQHSVSAPAEDQWDHQSRVGPETKPTEAMPFEPSSVGLILEAERPRYPERCAGQAVLHVDPGTHEAGGHFAGASGHDHLPRLLTLDHERPGGHQRSAAFGHEPQDQIQVGFAAERPRDLHGRVERVDGSLERVVLSVQAGVAPRVVDRDSRERGQQHDRPLVGLGELLAARLLGQVQVPERDAADQDRDPQERLHRRVARWKAVGVWMGADVGQPERHGMRDQLAEHPSPLGQIADHLTIVLVDADRDEPLELGARLVRHPERRVSRSRQLPRGLEHAPEHHLEVELG